MENNTMPLVALACICEKALEDKDGVLSLIRVIDTVFVERKADTPSDVFPAIECTAVVSSRSGDLVGSFDKLQIVLKAPKADSKKVSEKPIPTIFTGGAQGANVQVRLTLAVKEYGIFWFDVLWGDEMLTRVPLDVKPGSPAPTVG